MIAENKQKLYFGGIEPRISISYELVPKISRASLSVQNTTVTAAMHEIDFPVMHT